jgi:hypothetical protein
VGGNVLSFDVPASGGIHWGGSGEPPPGEIQEEEKSEFSFCYDRIQESLNIFPKGFFAKRILFNS